MLPRQTSVKDTTEQGISALEILMPHVSVAARATSENFIASCRISITLGATTVYEGGLQATQKMGGFQKKQYISGLASGWRSVMGATTAPSDHLHPLFSAILSQTQASEKAKSKSSASK
jgi:hypothetical protein